MTRPLRMFDEEAIADGSVQRSSPVVRWRSRLNGSYGYLVSFSISSYRALALTMAPAALSLSRDYQWGW